MTSEVTTLHQRMFAEGREENIREKNQKIEEDMVEKVRLQKAEGDGVVLRIFRKINWKYVVGSMIRNLVICLLFSWIFSPSGRFTEVLGQAIAALARAWFFFLNLL